MKGTFTGTGSTFTEIAASDGYIRGGQGKTGLLTLDFGTGTVQLRASTDNGANWGVIDSYTADTHKLVEFPSGSAVYDLNCSAYTADITYSLTS